MELREIVRKIDPTLEIAEVLSEPPNIVAITYSEDTPKILKIFPIRGRQINHLQREACALKRGEGIPGIPSLVKDYGRQEDFYAILREYAKGKTVEEMPSRTIQDEHLYSLLLETIHSLHTRGIANLDINRENVVVSPNKQTATIIDLGHAIFDSDYSFWNGWWKIHQAKQDDLNDLKNLCWKVPGII